MGTPYEEIDDMFLSDVKDDEILDFQVEDREEILNMLRKKATTRFKACKKDLIDRDDVAGEFNEELTDEEKLVIATIMRKYWLNDKIYNLMLLKQRMSTKNWRTTSQAEHLLRLTVLSEVLNKEISSMIVNYTNYNYKLDGSN